MAFYLKPPQGVLPLATLQTCVWERFQYLQALLRDGEMSTYVPKHFEYLIEGTAMDRAGHFLLRLISLSSPKFQEFVAVAERQFFLLRLTSYNSSQDVRALLKLLHRHATECSLQPNLSRKYHTFLLCAKDVCKKMMQKHVATHCFTKGHPSTCTELFVTMHFTHCLPMVQEREVELHSGNAFIPCGKWKELLALFFDEHIQFGIAQLCSTGCLESALHDPRIKELTKELAGNFKFKKCLSSGNYLSASEVKREYIFFPPCMRHLYDNLKAKHRLGHEARRHCTLFLKDAGMPLEEAIKFWSVEYSHPHHCSSCSHSWQQDSRRYIYSIRHMYGLEGGRYNYKTPSCGKIQAMSLTSMAEGGCPFVHFGEKQLKACLVDSVKNDHLVCSKILQLARDHYPKDACALHFSATLGQTSQITESINVEANTVKTLNPVQYYFNMKLAYDISSSKLHDSVSTEK